MAGGTEFRFAVPVFPHAATAAMAMMASAAEGDAGTRKLIIRNLQFRIVRLNLTILEILKKE
jgi:hypothetical protein